MELFFAKGSGKYINYRVASRSPVIGNSSSENQVLSLVGETMSDILPVIDRLPLSSVLIVDALPD